MPRIREKKKRASPRRGAVENRHLDLACGAKPSTETRSIVATLHRSYFPMRIELVVVLVRGIVIQKE